jgi:signal transduction histidine kinase
LRDGRSCLKSSRHGEYGEPREAHARQRSELAERDRARQVAAAVAGERRRIARELHDIISHALGVMVLQADAADQALDGEPAQISGN